MLLSIFKVEIDQLTPWIICRTTKLVNETLDQRSSKISLSLLTYFLTPVFSGHLALREAWAMANLSLLHDGWSPAVCCFINCIPEGLKRACAHYVIAGPIYYT